MLSEIVGQQDNAVVNIAINLGDFDTELTRYDIHHIKSSKKYWIKRIQDIMEINDSELKAMESEKLFNEMMQDKSMKKVSKGILSQGFRFTLGFLNAII